MLDNPLCPVCARHSWRRIGSRIYRHSDAAGLDSYTQKRYRVLFELWCPDRETVELTSQLCESCGFVIFAPRPTEEDLTAKYRFLGALGPDSNTLSADSPGELRRARDLWRRLKRHLPKGRILRVLDYGGGDGRLMRDFVAQGHECALVDYSLKAVAGVERIGATIDQIPVTAQFDAVVASHVIEHVAEPRQVVAALARLLSERGVLYVEVPMEIWGRAPMLAEPVTHVNFFTPASTRVLLESAGLRVVTCRLGAYLHPAGHWTLAVRAVGHLARRSLSPCGLPGSAETERYLRPNIALRLRRRFLMPRTIVRGLSIRLQRWIRV